MSSEAVPPFSTSSMMFAVHPVAGRVGTLKSNCKLKLVGIWISFAMLPAVTLANVPPPRKVHPPPQL